jgi:hypothetical protein
MIKFKGLQYEIRAEIGGIGSFRSGAIFLVRRRTNIRPGAGFTCNGPQEYIDKPKVELHVIKVE